MAIQRWVTDRLRRALSRRLDVEAEPRVDLDVAGRVRMGLDLVFRRERRAVYVGDINYELSLGLGRTGDYCQSLAYATARRLGEGVLIYCQDDEQAPDHKVTVRATRTGLWTYRLAMTGSTADVEQAVKDLAGWLVEKTASSVPSGASKVVSAVILG